MKKNFLMVASLLIAAMLLVVSCSPETKAEDNGLVEARLNVAYGRELDLAGVADAEDLTLKYTMVNQWTDQATGKVDEVYGEVTAETELPRDGKLGWVSKGYWTITVKAYKGNTTVFEGSTSIYFNNTNANATVYLAPAKSNTNSIKFNFYMQDLGKDYGTDFVVRYSIAQNGSVVTGHNEVDFIEDKEAKKLYKTESGVTTEASEGSVYDNQRVYEKTVSGLSSGYYTVTVSVYEKNESGDLVLKGGISKGMLLAGNTAIVSGHVEPSDYVATVLKTYYVDVETTLTKTDITYANDNKSATIKLSFTDSTDVTRYDSKLTANDFTKTYFWSVNGESYTQESGTVSVGVPVEKTVTVSKNGVNNIAVRTIYSLTVSGDKTYFWAETQDVSVQVTGIIY